MLRVHGDANFISSDRTGVSTLVEQQDTFTTYTFLVSIASDEGRHLWKD